MDGPDVRDGQRRRRRSRSQRRVHQRRARLDGPERYGPNPWSNMPNPRPGRGEGRVRLHDAARLGVSRTRIRALGGAQQRVLEEVEADSMNGYPYRIFARPAALAMYALAGLENTRTGKFIAVRDGRRAQRAREAPAKRSSTSTCMMDIPLDHTLDVRLAGLPCEGRAGPDRFKRRGEHGSRRRGHHGAQRERGAVRRGARAQRTAPRSVSAAEPAMLGDALRRALSLLGGVVHGRLRREPLHGRGEERRPRCPTRSSRSTASSASRRRPRRSTARGSPPIASSAGRPTARCRTCTSS